MKRDKEDPVAKLIAQIGRRNSSGSGSDTQPARYAVSDLRDLYPLLVMSAGDSLAWTATVQAEMNAFAERRGLSPSASPKAVQRAIERFYKTEFNQELLKEVHAFIRETALDLGNAVSSGDFEQFCGVARTDAAPPSSHQPSVKAGAGLRFELLAVTSKKRED